jgi:hypothetical protein
MPWAQMGHIDIISNLQLILASLDGQLKTTNMVLVQSRTTKARYVAAVGIPIRDITGTPPEARK